MRHSGGMAEAPSSVPYLPPRISPDEGLRRGVMMHDELDQRRSVRQFAPDPVPLELIEQAVAIANTAPSGAHQQPWTFVAIGDTAMKQRIREAAEAEEEVNYDGGRLPPAWREAIAPLGTDASKPFLQIAPWLVVVFAQKSTPLPDGSLRKNYYVSESVGIACGLFITALHRMGLVTLTHTPNPMGFLTEICGRPSTERPYVLMPVGYPADGCRVPDLQRKPLSEALVVFE